MDRGETLANDPTVETIDPANPTGPKVHAVIPRWWVTKLHKTQPVDFENLRAVKFVLENVERIFYGVRDFNEGGWCYTGRPERWFIRVDIEVPFPPNRVLAVYLNPDLRVYEFRAEKVDPDDLLSPIDWKERYGGLTWKSTSSKT